MREFVVVLTRPRHPWRLTFAATGAAVLLGGVVGLGWTWRHPQAFTDVGGWGAGYREAEIGQTFYVGMTYPRDHDGGHVTLHGGRVDVVRGGDLATTELLLCSLDPSANVGAIGAYVGDGIRDDCAELEPIEGARLDLHDGPMRQQVVLAVTMVHPGRVKVAGISLDYSDRWQAGTQRTGGEVVVSTGRGSGRR